MSGEVFISGQEYFPGIPAIGYEGPGSDNPLSFKTCEAQRVVADKTMEQHLRFPVANWHTPAATAPGGTGAFRPVPDRIIRDGRF